MQTLTNEWSMQKETLPLKCDLFVAYHSAFKYDTKISIVTPKGPFNLLYYRHNTLNLYTVMQRYLFSCYHE